MPAPFRFRLVAAVCAVGLLAAACGGGEESEDSETATDTGESPTEMTVEESPSPAETSPMETSEPMTPESPTDASPDGGSDGGDGTLDLGYLLPETGDLASIGNGLIQGVQFARSQINEAGGVLGNDVPEISGSDEAGDEAIANESADRLLSEDVDAIMGAAASGMSLAVIDRITGAETLQCSGSNTSPTFTGYEDNGGYYIRTAPSDALQGPVLAETVAGDGNASVAVVARADDYGTALADATQNALEEAGAEVPVNTTYDTQATNFDSVVSEVASAEPDAVVLVSFPEDGSAILQTMIEQGLGPQAVDLYGTDGLQDESLPDQVAQDQPGVLSGMKGTAPAGAGGSEDFVSSLQEFAPDLENTIFSAQFYDCVIVTALAAEAAGSDAPSAMVDEVNAVTREGTECTSFEECKSLLSEGENIDYQGASGPLEFTDDGEPSAATIESWRFTEEGSIETLDTTDVQLDSSESS